VEAKAVAASAVGVIVDHIVPGTGILLDEPTDLEAFGKVVRDPLGNPYQIEQMGRAARQYVHENFIGDLHLLRYAALIEKLLMR
jgi:trehalose synthase